MATATETLTTADRIRAAEAGLARTQAVLAKAQSGLRAAGTVAERAQRVGDYRWQVLLGVVGLLAVVTALTLIVRRRQSRKEEEVSVLAA